MKLNKILLGFLGLGLFASCSQEDVVPSPGGNTDELKPDGYIGVNLVLPSVNGTRADEESPETPGESASGTTTSGSSFNDQFADGEPSEYKVNNGLILIFKGTKGAANEGATKFYGAYDLGVSGSNPGAGNQNVTTSYTRSVKVTGLNLTDTEDIYGLVFLNYNTAGIRLLDNRGIEINGNTFNMPEEATTPGTGEATDPEDTEDPGTTRADDSTDDTTSTASPAGATFADIMRLVSNQKFYNGNEGETANGIFMTNSPLANTAGESKDPTAGFTKVDEENNTVNVPFEIKTLVKLTDGIKPTQAEAEADPAGTIYVERGVAKVTCSNFCGFDSGALSGNTTPSLTLGEYSLVIKDIKWSIGNEQEDSYIVRNATTGNIDWKLASTFTGMNPAKKFRMVGAANGIEMGNNEWYYRPYWCIDPNYGKDLHADGKVVTDADGNEIPAYAQTRKFIQWTKDGVFYPHENTFTVENMTYGNTTRICFNVTFEVYDKAGKKMTGSNFYTRNDDRKTLYFDDENNNNPLMQNVLADLGENEELKEIYLASLDHSTAGSAVYNPADVFKIEINDPDETGLLSVKSITFVNDALNTTDNKKTLGDLVETLNIEYKFYEFTGGNVFYSSTPIKHFGDDLTPWKTEGAASTVEESYTGRSDFSNYNDNWLGRYGLVRNNWYDIQVSAITKLGDPRDPAIWNEEWPGTPDDNNPQYLAVRIAILSWAKRLQNVEF